ncbi:DUF4131 domain-containing protein [Pedobacter sp. ASV28]|uniref:DUF4131 domain-containing protein n=1 Tax=Pedobacter sp. ASV28 TaxID=2795123 RepID=UPI0018EC9438|nr:DUF4131 domain-containing protein [Pedobacter sp. ASV28]
MIFKSEIVFVKILLPLICGITLAYSIQSVQWLNYTTIAFCTCLFFAAFVNLFYKRLKIWKYKKLTSIFYYLIFFLFGAFLCFLQTDFTQPHYFAAQDVQYLKGSIDSEPQQNNDILRFEIKLAKS